MKIDSLITKIMTGASPCVLGLDMGYSELPLEFMRGAANKGEAVRAFNRLVIGTVADIIPAVSVNVASLLPYGTETIADAVLCAREKGLFTIVDAKFSGDAAEASAASELYFDTMGADCITATPYFGFDGLLPILERCRDGEKSIFVVAHSDGGSPRDVQELVAGTRGVYRVVCEKTVHLGDDSVGATGYSSVGIAVGGLPNSTLSELRRVHKNTLMLVTGYDGKKTSAHDINGAFDIRGLGGLALVSRAICSPDGEGAYSERLRTAAEEVIRDLKLCF